MAIPVIDLFAGPGGLGEGFSAVNDGAAFDIKLSIEKNPAAHQTLELRSFVHQFEHRDLPRAYYEMYEESNLAKRDLLKQKLFYQYPRQYEKAKNIAWRCTLGSPEFPPEIVNKRIAKALAGEKNWVLIGGPPCQAYSVVGRSRLQWKDNLDEKDHRVHLYKEYLRIIADHHPAVFVMENVRGILSSKLNGEVIFDKILRDLKNPGIIFKKRKAPRYKVFSLAKDPMVSDGRGNPYYEDYSDYLIKAENYGVPQNRHRVILLGIREDISVSPKTLKKAENIVSLSEVIGDLPKIRSGINRSFVRSEMVDGMKKRFYRKETDSDNAWKILTNSLKNEIISWNGFAKDYSANGIEIPLQGRGSEFVPCETPLETNPLFDWYHDPKLKGIANHESRIHLVEDLKRYMFSSMFTKTYNRFPRLHEFETHSDVLLPDHENAKSGKFADRFRVQVPDQPATTVTSHISKDGHYFIHYDPNQCRSLTVREAARIQTFPDNYLFCGPRTAQYHQVGNAVPPLLANKIGKVVLDIFLQITRKISEIEKLVDLQA
ncbi:DNA cytosine methyltransferase [Cyclobacterium sp. SYSU L10401]|uniref:DNA cytosine methyltransferase n=1 Tax=Cyclobacterium sp. SYSU L10401 TaxID=2678657 RepID=UPI0013D1C6F2|nr:DNA cytosine methyltransferase [Cyclobacterium sp. SYSU L10401]